MAWSQVSKSSGKSSTSYIPSDRWLSKVCFNELIFGRFTSLLYRNHFVNCFQQSVAVIGRDSILTFIFERAQGHHLNYNILLKSFVVKIRVTARSLIGLVWIIKWSYKWATSKNHKKWDRWEFHFATTNPSLTNPAATQARLHTVSQTRICRQLDLFPKCISAYLQDLYGFHCDQ